MKHSIKKITLNLHAQAAKMGGDLGATLGQHGVNIIKFCKEFNEFSTKFEYNLLIRVFLLLEDNGNFTIKLMGPTSSFLIKSLARNNILSLTNAYKISLILSNNLNIKNILSHIISTTKTLQIKINYYE